MKFTHEKPTVPGWYIHRYHKDEMAVKIVSVKEDLWTEIGRVADMEGEWSERLVPVGEVQIAFVEGACAARHWSHLKPHELWDSGVKTRARRVVEGKEEV